MVTGSSAYQELFQGLLAERVNAGGMDSLVPVVRLTDDSIGSGGSVGGNVTVTNFPNPQIISGAVSVINFPVMQGISGSIAVTVTPPISQGISGTVNVGNFPALQGISGSVTVVPPILQGISGSVSVNNFPSLQGISGSVSTIPPIMQGISGSVAVSSLPSPVIVSGAALDISFPGFPVADRFEGTYTGTTLNSFLLKRGGSGGVIVASGSITTDALGNITTFQVYR